MKRFFAILIAAVLIAGSASAATVFAPLDLFLQRFDAFALPDSLGHATEPEGPLSTVRLQCGDHLVATVHCTERDGKWMAWKVGVFDTPAFSDPLGVFYLADIMLQCYAPDLSDEARHQLLGEVAVEFRNPDIDVARSDTDDLTFIFYNSVGSNYFEFVTNRP